MKSAILALLGACSGQEAFVCHDAGQCVLGDAAGRCEPAGYCSFPDDTCPSRYRVGDYAPADVAGTCVTGQMVTLEAVADAWLDSDKPGIAYGASGTLRTDASPERHALLRFDLTSLPAGAHVLAATLAVTTTDAGGLGAGSTDIYAITESWVEGERDAKLGHPNWTVRAPAMSWTTAGGSHGAAPLASFQPMSSATEYDVDLAAQTVEAWAATPAENLGILFIVRDSADRSVIVYSREDANAGRRPRLIVVYETS